MKNFFSRPLLALLVCLMLVLGVSGVAVAVGKTLHTHNGYITTVYSPWGKSYTHDRDKKVPEYNRNLPEGVAGRTRLGERAFIRYDYEFMQRNNATGCGWDRVMRHERAHARGFAHGEGFPPNGDGIRQTRENPAYYPSVNIRCQAGSENNRQAVAEYLVDMTGDTEW